MDRSPPVHRHLERHAHRHWRWHSRHGYEPMKQLESRSRGLEPGARPRRSATSGAAPRRASGVAGATRSIPMPPRCCAPRSGRCAAPYARSPARATLRRAQDAIRAFRHEARDRSR